MAKLKIGDRIKSLQKGNAIGTVLAFYPYSKSYVSVVFDEKVPGGHDLSGMGDGAKCAWGYGWNCSVRECILINKYIVEIELKG